MSISAAELAAAVSARSTAGSPEASRNRINDALRGTGDSFARRLDVAILKEQAGKPPSPEVISEVLKLDMLRSSLSLSGDSEPAMPGSVSPSMSSTLLASLLKSYQEQKQQHPTEAEPPVPPPVFETPPVQPKSVSLPVLPRVEPSSPGRFEPIIEKASRRYGVDAGLIKAVIKAESNFNPNAVSHAGARGLMQLMPATARGLGVTDSFDPEQNIMAGTRFLKDMLNRYGGDTDSALAAYNWGPGNVDRRPDRLPRETREYLVRVKQLYADYSA